MKRKKRAVAGITGAAASQPLRSREGEAVPTPAAAAHPTAQSVWKDRVMVGLFPLLLFLAMTVQTATMSLLLAALALALSLGKEPLGNVRARLGVPVLGLLVFLLLCTAAGLYSSFGRYAIGEFVKVLASGSVALALLFRGKRGQGRPLLWGFSIVCGGISLICTDVSCNGPLFRGFVAVMSRLGSDYSDVPQAMYAGARFNGIYADANLTGSLLALGMFVGLYLVHTAAKREKLAASFLLGLSATGFLLAMSRGAILCFAVALVVYLAAVGKERRLSLFFLMLAAALCTVVFTIFAFFLLSTGSFLGTAVTLLCGPAIWLVDGFLFQPLLRVFIGRLKLLGTLAAMMAAAGIVLVVVAFQITKPYAFEGERGFLLRTASVEPGASYTLSSDHDGGEEALVRIYGRNPDQQLLNQSSIYYSGPLDEAAFTVPEDVNQIFLRFDGPDGAELRSATLSDGQNIRMAYRLLPRNITNRLQGNFFQDSSFLVRVQYLKDGWTLFTQSPLFGYGLGSTEGLLTSVQPFYYESLYLHNHLLQIMVESGLLGLAAFLSLMLGAAWLLVCRLRREADPLAAALLACLAMMNLHGLMELSFSVRMFQCAAFFLLILAVVEYAPVGEHGRLPGWLAMGGSWVWLAVSALLVLGSVTAQNHYWAIDADEMEVEVFLDTMEDLDRIDFYTDMDYKINRMVNSLQLGGSANRQTALLCAQQLMRTGDFDACYSVAAYYYLPLSRLPDFFRAAETGLAQERSNQAAWNSVFNLYRQAMVQIDAEEAAQFARGVSATAEKLSGVSAELLSSIELSAENQAFLNVALMVADQGLEGEAARLLLSAAAQEGAA